MPQSTPASLHPSTPSVEPRILHTEALVLGSRLDDRTLQRQNAVATLPLTLRVGDGHAVVFRFGVVVLFDLPEAEAERFLALVRPCLQQPFEVIERESTEIRIEPDGPEGIGSEHYVRLLDLTPGRMQVVALALAKSALLGHFEVAVTQVFDRVETLAEQLRRGGRFARSRPLLREIGDVLLIQARTVGRAEVTEKPELTWDEPVLDRLYERLASEYELRDRDLALSRKLDLIQHTAQTYLDLVQNRQTLRVEWYIVLLIVFEILLSLYDFLLRP